MALKAGAIRFNTDSSQMEIYDGNQWTGILATSPELQTGGGRIFSWEVLMLLMLTYKFYKYCNDWRCRRFW